MTPFVEYAVKFGLRGLRVFPCLPQSKKPAFEDNLRLASMVEMVIRKFWSNPNYNIAIATGRGSGVWVWDVDGDEGRETMRSLEAEHGPLPPTVMVITGDDGEHYYFNQPKRLEVRCAVAIRPGIDVRGEGGYAMAPPSIHPNGRAYAWSVDSADHFADAPDWLIQIVTERSSRRSASNGQAVAPTLPKDWEALLSRTHSGSHRAGALAKFCGLQLRKYIDPAVVITLAQWFDERLCDPPLGHDEVARIFCDIAEREADRRDGR